MHHSNIADVSLRISELSVCKRALLICRLQQFASRDDEPITRGSSQVEESGSLRGSIEALCAQLLNVSEVGEDDNLFDIFAEQVAVVLNGHLGIAITGNDVARRPTICGLAQQIETHQRADDPNTLLSQLDTLSENEIDLILENMLPGSDSVEAIPESAALSAKEPISPQQAQKWLSELERLPEDKIDSLLLLLTPEKENDAECTTI